VIIGFTELAMGKMGPTDPLRSDLDEVLKAAIRATDITRQLLAFARKQTIAPKVLDLNENIENMLKMLRSLIGEDINIAWLPGAELQSIKMDPSQIDQILANLCVNARDAIVGVGKISIETKMVSLDATYCADHHGFIPGNFVMLAVSDSGCGMDKEILDNIFEPFFTTKAADKGTGLGLSTVYGIVKQNNGFIHVYSEPGKGTTVKIYFPPDEGNSVKSYRINADNLLTGRGETILIVEDDPSILRMVSRILQELAYTVLTSSTPKGAISLAEEHPGEISLLLSDVIMPEMNGLQLSIALQTFYPDIACIFMSGYTANIIADHGVLDEGMHFIQKPFSKSDLAETIRKVLDEVTEVRERFM
jgi:two-component system, cell cycle sensor histidine kinase and response regulator CckA